jgi:protein N-terminal methyltransferase
VGRTNLDCRTDKKLREIFGKAGLKIMQTQIQNGLPERLLAVRMYALKPVVTTS